MRYAIKRAFFLITIFGISNICPANNFPSFEPIAKKDYPALVFIEEDANPNPNLLLRGTLYVAGFKDGKVKCHVCANQCSIVPDKVGICRTRKNFNVYNSPSKFFRVRQIPTLSGSIVH